MRSLEMELVECEAVSPEAFRELYSREAEKIESARFVPPDLDSDSFGCVLLRWKTPHFRHAELLRAGEDLP